jgi:hypothetical protein
MLCYNSCLLSLSACLTFVTRTTSSMCKCIDLCCCMQKLLYMDTLIDILINTRYTQVLGIAISSCVSATLFIILMVYYEMAYLTHSLQNDILPCSCVCVCVVDTKSKISVLIIMQRCFCMQRPHVTQLLSKPPFPGNRHINGKTLHQSLACSINSHSRFCGRCKEYTLSVLSFVVTFSDRNITKANDSQQNTRILPPLRLQRAFASPTKSMRFDLADKHILGNLRHP